MKRWLTSVIFLTMAVPRSAQVQIGTGANGGICYGVNCGPGAPPNLGTGARGGVCFGPNCSPVDNPNRSFGLTDDRFKSLNSPNGNQDSQRDMFNSRK